MNRYQKAMETCPVPAELEERLKRRVLAEKPWGGRHRRIIRPRSFARRALLAACGALLTISAGAVVLTEWDAIFTERFGGAASSTAMAESAFQRVDVTSVCDDVTLTIREALGDDKTIYLILDYQLPQTVDRAAVQAAWDSGEDTVGSPTVRYFATGDVTWEELKREDADLWSRMDWADWTSFGGYLMNPKALQDAGFPAGGSASAEGRAFDAETGTLTYLLRYTTESAWDITEQPLTLLVPPPTMTVDGKETALADHPAIITIQPDYPAKSLRGEIRADGVSASAVVSALAIQVEYAGADYAQLEDLVRDIRLVYDNGGQAALTELAQGFGGGKGGAGMNFSAAFLELVDLSQVRAVRVGELEIPLRSAE